MSIFRPKTPEQKADKALKARFEGLEARIEQEVTALSGKLAKGDAAVSNQFSEYAKTLYVKELYDALAATTNKADKELAVSIKEQGKVYAEKLAKKEEALIAKINSIKIPSIKGLATEEELTALKRSLKAEIKAEIKKLPEGSNGFAIVRSALTKLTDVVITSPTDGQSLVYDSATGKWINETVIPDLTPYARLDGTNQPFTGDISASNLSGTNTGDQVFIQPDEPAITAPSLWVQTGLGCKGTGFSLWYIEA